MERMEIKLKDRCLSCEHFLLDTSGIGVYCACGDGKREIACVHMPVCYKYANMEPVERLKRTAIALLDAYEYHTDSLRSACKRDGSAYDSVFDEIIAGREENAKEYRREIENV